MAGLLNVLRRTYYARASIRNTHGATTKFPFDMEVGQVSSFKWCLAVITANILTVNFESYGAA